MFGRSLFINHRGLVTIYIYQYCLYLYVDYILCTVPMHIIIYTYYNHNLQDPHVSSNSFELFFFGGGASQVDHFLKKNTAELKCCLAKLFQMDGFFVFGEGGKSSYPSKNKKHRLYEAIKSVLKTRTRK